jgi:hypothetical protein
MALVVRQSAEQIRLGNAARRARAAILEMEGTAIEAAAQKREMGRVFDSQKDLDKAAQALESLAHTVEKAVKAIRGRLSNAG